MSLKVSTFEGFLGNPLNIHNFICTIPALQAVQILVRSTVFPVESYQNYTLYFQGERVKFPSLPTNSGEWAVTMPEGELSKVWLAYTHYYRKTYNQKEGTVRFWSATDKFDITVTSRTLTGNVVGSEKLFTSILHGCFVVGPSDVTLDQASATQHWEWNIRFSYDWIEYQATGDETEAQLETDAPTYGKNYAPKPNPFPS